MKNKHLLFAALFLAITSCGDDYNFSSPKSADWDVVNEKNENLETLRSWVINSKSTDAKSALKPIKVNVRNEVNKLYMPKNNPCGSILPQGLKSKIDSNPYVPQELSTFLKDLRIIDTADLYPGESLSSILHTFKIKHLNEYIQITSPTRDNFLKEDFLIQDKSKYIFTTDCSGFINGVASVALSRKMTGEFKASLSSSVGREGAVLIGLATFKSPLLIAIFPDAAASANYKMPDSTRTDILKNILTRLKSLPDTTQIEIFENYQLLFSSKSQSAKFNGKAEINANAGINAAGISASAELGASLKVSRSTIMDNFNVIVLDAKPYLSSLKITKKLIEETLNEVGKAKSSDTVVGKPSK